MYITSIKRYQGVNHKVITHWGKKYEKFIGVENHYVNNTLLSKKYIVAGSKNRVVIKDRNLFGQFDVRG